MAGEILKALEDEKLLHLFSPALTGLKLNLAGFQKWQKARQLLPQDVEVSSDSYALFLFLLLEKLSAKERTQLIKSLGIPKTALDAAGKLEARAKKVEKELTAVKSQKPSALYAILSKVPGEILAFLLMRSSQRLVIDRVKNYLQKYLPMAQEVTEQDVVGAEPGSPKFAKLYQKLVAGTLGCAAEEGCGGRSAAASAARPQSAFRQFRAINGPVNSTLFACSSHGASGHRFFRSIYSDCHFHRPSGR